MIKITKQSLAKLVLASTLFVCPAVVLGAITISTPTTTAVTYFTSVFGDITIAPTGSLSNSAVINDLIDINTPGGLVTVAPNNINPFALNTTSGAAVRFSSSNGKLIVGENSNVFNPSGPIIVSTGSTGAIIENHGNILPTIGVQPSIIVAGPANSISNSGTASWIFLSSGGNVTSGITNTGTLDLVSAMAGATLTGGLTNSGTITGSLSGNAVELNIINSNVLFTNDAPGIVNGNVYLSSNVFGPGTVLQMNGGEINGTVLLTGAGSDRTLNVAGGSIASISIAISNTADIINQSGGTIGTITGNAGSNQTLNILGPVTTGGSITNMSNVVVQNLGDFTVINPISGGQNISVNSGGVLTNNNTISSTNTLTVSGLLTNNASVTTATATINGGGTFVANPTGTTNFTTLNNNGTLFLQLPFPNSNTNVTTGTYNQSIPALLEVQIKDISNYGNMEVTNPAVLDVTGLLLKPDLTGGFIRNLDTFTIIDQSGGGTILGKFDIIQPPSATISFLQLTTISDVILQAIRRPFEDIAGTNPITIPPGISIDAILASGQPLSPLFQSFIIGLDSLTTQAEVNAALSTVVPQYDGGLVRLSHMIQHTVFEGLGKYLDEHRPLTSLIPGYVAGDVGMGRWNQFEYSRGTWAQAFASRAVQKDNSLSEGYDLEDIGAVFGYDQYCSDRVILGGALSYATGNINTKDISKDTQSVKSFQMTAYSTYDYKGPGYLDVMAGVAFNNYDATRNIIAGTFVATSTAEFTAWNYGVNLETGYRLSYGKYRIIPVARAMYSRLQIDNYTEEGAGGLSLSVLNEPVEEGITAIGIKFNSTNYYEEAAYVPEFRFNIIYDWINDPQSTHSNFLEGGPAFITNSFQPHPCIYNLGLSLTALASESTVFVLNGELDLQRDYVAYNVSMKFRYEW